MLATAQKHTQAVHYLRMSPKSSASSELTDSGTCREERGGCNIYFLAVVCRPGCSSRAWDTPCSQAPLHARTHWHTYNPLPSPACTWSPPTAHARTVRALLVMQMQRVDIREVSFGHRQPTRSLPPVCNTPFTIKMQKREEGRSGRREQQKTCKLTLLFSHLFMLAPAGVSAATVETRSAVCGEWRGHTVSDLQLFDLLRAQGVVSFDGQLHSVFYSSSASRHS